VAAAAVSCALNGSVDPSIFTKAQCDKLEGLSLPVSTDHLSWWKSEEVKNLTKLDL